MKLFSPFPRVIPVSLTSGHTFVVTQEPVEVPEIFVAEARARGALSSDEAIEASGSSQSTNASEADGDGQVEATAQRTEAIHAALNAMLDGSDAADFTADGKPQLLRVKARTGFAVNRAEVDAAWAQISAKI